ncbi:MAG: hypothetical protein Q8761_03100 [Sweet potato little leaf phytoplasma]|nr:hypothetical protein [Sweet potato little leaf phytoplasma]
MLAVNASILVVNTMIFAFTAVMGSTSKLPKLVFTGRFLYRAEVILILFMP